MEQLKEKLTSLVRELEKEKHDQVMQRLEDLVSVYPFNDYEFLISSLMGYGKISIDDYYELRDDYIAKLVGISINMKQVSVDQAAQIIGVSSATIRNWAKAGHIDPVCTCPLLFLEDSVLGLKSRIGTDFAGNALIKQP